MKHFAILYKIDDKKSDEFEKEINSDERVLMYYSDDGISEDGHSSLLRSFKNDI